MKIYTDVEQIIPTRRAYLADILRPYFNTRTPQQNLALYGPNLSLHQVVESLPQADLGVLPLSWNYYLQQGNTAQAWHFVERVQRASKPAVVWVSGDLSLRPPLPGTWLFMAGGYQSTRQPRQFSIPVFINDPLLALETAENQLREKTPLPLVGFCGQADDSPAGLAWKSLRLAWHNLKHLLGLSPFEKQPWLPPTYLRSRTLNLLERSPAVQTNFLRRRQYKAGAKTVQQAEVARREFFTNILNSDYTLCLRGTGNFSARLYETMAMGRIPLFINTDCILPYDRWIDWKKTVVWIEQSRLDQAAQVLSKFHQELSPSDFKELQIQARHFWQKELTFNGFLGQFEHHFD